MPLPGGFPTPLVVLSHCPAPSCSFWSESRSQIDFVPCGHFREAAIPLIVGEFSCHLPLAPSLPGFACFAGPGVNLGKGSLSFTPWMAGFLTTSWRGLVDTPHGPVDCLPSISMSPWMMSFYCSGRPGRVRFLISSWRSAFPEPFVALPVLRTWVHFSAASLGACDVHTHSHTFPHTLTHMHTHSHGHILTCAHAHTPHTHTERVADLVKVEEWLTGGKWVGGKMFQ